MYRGLYSIGFIASCRLSWFIARDPPLQVKQYVLAQPKNNLDTPPASLAYTIEGDGAGNARIAWRGLSTLDDSDLMRATPERLRIRMRAQAFLLDFLKNGPRNTREIWEAAQAHRFSRATLDRTPARAWASWTTGVRHRQAGADVGLLGAAGAGVHERGFGYAGTG